MENMDGFSYTDMFATKGVEYILVIVFLVIFVFYMRALYVDRSRSDDRGRKT